MRTYSPRIENIKREWHLIDAHDRVLGRLASEVAKLLMGKHKVTYSPHLSIGDHVVVINAARVRVTGRKEKQKNYYRHSGFPGGLRSTPLEKMRKEHPERIIRFAVMGMIPNNKLRPSRLKNLHIYNDEFHPYKDKFQLGYGN